MLLIPPESKVVYKTIFEHLQSCAAGSDSTSPNRANILTTSILSDFDGTIYKLSRGSVEDPTIKCMVTLSATLQGFEAVANALGPDFLQETCYAPFIQPPENFGGIQFHVTLTASVDAVDAADDGYHKFAYEWACIKRNIIGRPLERALAGLTSDDGPPDLNAIAINFRPDEHMFVCPRDSAVTAVFALGFLDPVDMEIGKVFLEEFTVARKGAPALGGVPVVNFTPGPPGELDTVLQAHLHTRDKANKGVEHETLELTGYLSLTFEARHVSTPEKLGKAVCRGAPSHLLPLTLVSTFDAITLQTGAPAVAGPPAWPQVDLMCSMRLYLHYHIKCCKSYMMTRMRYKAGELLKKFNEADPTKGHHAVR